MRTIGNLQYGGREASLREGGGDTPDAAQRFCNGVLGTDYILLE